MKMSQLTVHAYHQRCKTKDKIYQQIITLLMVKICKMPKFKSFPNQCPHLT